MARTCRCTPGTSCSKLNSGVWMPTITSPLCRYFACQARRYGKVRRQLMHVKVQKSTTTTLPRKSSAPKGLEFNHSTAPRRGGIFFSPSQLVARVTRIGPAKETRPLNSARPTSRREGLTVQVLPTDFALSAHRHNANINGRLKIETPHPDRTALLLRSVRPACSEHLFVPNFTLVSDARIHQVEYFSLIGHPFIVGDPTVSIGVNLSRQFRAV